MSTHAASGLSADELDRLREALERRRKEVEEALTASREGVEPVGLDLSIGRLTRIDALASQQMAAANRRRLESQLVQIQNAFSRLAEGRFGLCGICEEPIERKRLSAYPESPLCLQCQAQASR